MNGSFNIIHLGGPEIVVRGIARYQSLQGHQVEVFGDGKPFSTSPAGSKIIESAKEFSKTAGRVIHIHSLRSLLYPDLDLGQVLPWILFLKDKGNVVALTLFNEDLKLIDSFVSRESFKKLISICSAVFVCGVGFSELVCEHRNCALMPIAVDCSLVARPPPVEPTNRTLKALYINYLSDPSYAEWLQGICSFPGSRLQLELQTINSSDIESLPTLLKILKDTDIVIEDVNSSSYGVVGAHALLFGKTVIAGAAIEASRQELQLSPVISTTAAGITDKLYSLMKEPRSLRDLIKRGRNFVEQFHRAETIVGIMLDHYHGDWKKS